jgi:hypothetical protein
MYLCINDLCVTSACGKCTTLCQVYGQNLKCVINSYCFIKILKIIITKLLK